ncbi:MAG: hypothetical protein HOH74_02425, partial [Gemmatimonadetes bacterium]|nr:hypothetical protein [Gemmatimonadota bacterium]
MRAGSRVAIAVPAAGSIVVDGRLNDWPATAPEHPLRRVTAGDPINDDSDFAASFRLAWDDEGGLYIAVDIIDEAVVINDGSGDWRTQDGIELVLRAASSDEEGAVHQIALWGDHLLGSDQGLQLQTSGDAGHRLFEWRIDTASLDIDLPADRRIALDLSVNDRDDDGSFTTINWGDADRAASGLGEALLLTSPVAIGTVKGTILRDGKAVARGLVQLRPVGDTDHAWDLQADRDGRFALRLPHGAYEVSRVADSTNAVSADLRADSVEVEIRTSRSLEQSQTLGSGVTVNAGPGTAVEASFGIQKGLWRTYGLPDGLASTSIDAIYQDRNGYLWFGTQGGVSRYDGTHFTTFTIDDGLAYNGVSAIAEDADGTLWFGTWGGLSRYDGLTFTTYTTADGLADDLVLALHRGSAGRLWIGTQSGLNCLDGSDLHTYSVGHGLPHEHISAIAEEPDGSLWFGTWGGGASHFDGDDFTTYAGIDLGHDEISDIGVDAEGGIWFATQSGVSRIFGDHVRRYTETDGLAHNAASSLAFDALGRLWVGTWEGGVSRLTAAGFVNFDSDAGLAHNEVSTIAADGDGHMWFGTWGGGISRYDGNNFEHFSDVDLAGAAKALWQDHKGRLWVGTSAGLYRKDRHGFHHYTTSDGLAHNAVNAITEDQSGILWIGTQSGLSRLDGDGNVTSFTTDDGLPHNWVNAVHCDAGGRLWLGTWGGGAARFDGESFVTYNDANGLGHDWVNTIYEDGFGRLWFG